METDWKVAMDKLYEETAKSWWETGNAKKSCGLSATFNLGRGKGEKVE